MMIMMIVLKVTRFHMHDASAWYDRNYNDKHDECNDDEYDNADDDQVPHASTSYAGVLQRPCFPKILARTTFVLESLLEAKNPGQDAIFGDCVF